MGSEKATLPAKGIARSGKLLERCGVTWRYPGRSGLKGTLEIVCPVAPF